jgi:hypothetical protein
MVKIKDLDEAQLAKQLKKHTKILKALRRESAKRSSEGEIELNCDSTHTGARVRQTGTLTNHKVEKTAETDKTSSSLYQLTMDEDELSKVHQVAKDAKPAQKQMTISKLIIQSQVETLKDKE